MFKFLKDKLKKAVSKFSKEVDKQAEEIVEEEAVEEKIEEPKKAESVEESVEEKPEEKVEEKEEKKEEIKKKEKPEPVEEEVLLAEEKPEEKVEEKEEVKEEPKPEPVPEPQKEPGPVEELKPGPAKGKKEKAEEKEAIIEIKEEPKPEIKVVKEPVHEPAKEEVKETEPEKESKPAKEKPEEKTQEKVEEKQREKPADKKSFFGKLKERFTKTEEERAKEEESLLHIPEKEVPKPPTEEKVKEIADALHIEHEPIKKEEPEPEKKPEPVKEKPQEKIKEKVEQEQKVKEKPKLKAEPEKPRIVVPDIEEEEEKKGFFSRLTESVTKKTLSEAKFDELFWELELVLLENNVAVEVIEKIKKDLKAGLVDKKVPRSKVGSVISDTLMSSISQLFDVPSIDLLEEVKKKKPYVITFVGVNGSGKTTTIGKVAQLLLDNNLKCVMAAADTFRAAAIQQLEEHANNVGVKIIKHDYGADPAAVAYDAIKYAEAHGIDVVLVDTAGRLHSNVNLMDEMKKIIRVAKPDMKIFVGESITGNDCIEQAKQFNEAVDIDGIILSKADIDEKGGAAISVSYVTGKPILYIGTGQTYKDLKPFTKELVLENMGFE